MITVAFAALGWFAIARWLIHSEGWPDEAIGWLMFWFLSIVTFGVAIAAGCGVAELVGQSLPDDIDHQPSHVAQLVALRSADGIEGNFSGGFFLGVGHIGTELYYFWYEREAGGITPRHLSAGHGTYVYEEDRAAAELRVYEWHFRRHWWSWFAFDDAGKTWEFHVPKGTVKQGYSL